MTTVPAATNINEPSEIGDIYIMHKFIRNVFIILLVQFLILTFSLYNYLPLMCESIRNNFWLWFIVVLFVNIFVYILAIFCPYKHNLYLSIANLILVTISFSLVFGVLNCVLGYYLMVILTKMVAVVSLAIVLFAIQTYCKFTLFVGCFIVSVTFVFFFAILTLCWWFGFTHYFKNLLLLLIPTVIGLALCLTFVINARLITMGYADDLKPDEYILGVLYIIYGHTCGKICGIKCA